MSTTTQKTEQLLSNEMRRPGKWMRQLRSSGAFSASTWYDDAMQARGLLTRFGDSTRENLRGQTYPDLHNDTKNPMVFTF
jgi:hypothetical protein